MESYQQRNQPMRIVINIDPIRENGKRMRIRTRYQLGTRDGRPHLAVANALVEFYNDLTSYITEGADPKVTDVVDEGERI